MGHWLPPMITGPWQEKGSEASPEADGWPALFWDRKTWGRPSFDGCFSLGNSVFLRVSEAWDGMDSTYSSLQTIPSWLSNKHDEETKNSGMLVDVALQGRTEFFWDDGRIACLEKIGPLLTRFSIGASPFRCLPALFVCGFPRMRQEKIRFKKLRFRMLGG